MQLLLKVEKGKGGGVVPILCQEASSIQVHGHHKDLTAYHKMPKGLKGLATQSLDKAFSIPLLQGPFARQLIEGSLSQVYAYATGMTCLRP